jgi:uroporphyrinogen decarboxylase
LETAITLRGRTDVLRDLATGGGVTVPLLDRLVELKRRYWEVRLSEAAVRAAPPTLVLESERLDVVKGFPISRKDFRDLLLPRWKSVFEVIRSLSPSSVLFLFCEAYRHDVLPDWIEAGVGVVNLLPTTVTEAKPAFLKREFGESLTFWGGSVRDAESFLKGTPVQASDHVKETLDVFAPEGGFVWSLLPIPETDVPPENIVAALDTLMEYGLY